MNEDRQRTTEGLIDKAREDDPDAFAEVFRRYRGRLDLWISLRLGPLLKTRLTKDDVMQETFLEAYRSLDGFHDQGEGSFRRWLFSVAENRLKDLHKFHTAQKRDPAREVKRSPAAETGDDNLARIAARSTSPSSGAHRRDLAERVLEAVRGLPDPLREVFVMRAIEERTLKEIAEHVGKRPATVQVWFLRALKRLKDDLAPRR